MKIKAIIIEDNQPDLELLKNELENNCSHLVTIAATYADYDSALKGILEQRPHLVFLKIELPKGCKGYNLVQETLLAKYQFWTVVVTGKSREYAQQAFDYDLLDCIQKPVTTKRLLQSLDKVTACCHQFLKAKQKACFPEKKKIVLREVGKFTLEELDNIEYLSSDGSNTYFHHTDRSSKVLSRNLGYFEPLLADHGFCRISRKHIINLHNLVEYRNGEVLMKSGKDLPISTNSVARLREMVDRLVVF